MNKPTFSIKQIQDVVLDQEEWGEKKTIYATDSEKCPSGIYYSLKGISPSVPIDPESLRRMDTGKFVEDVQIKKLKKLGILIEPESGLQHRVFNSQYNVSGRLDALVISPDLCSKESREIIERKKLLNSEISKFKSNFYLGLDKLNKEEISEEEFKKGRTLLTEKEDLIYKELRGLNKELLRPDPKNHLMVVEIKSSNEWGFKYFQKEGKPNSSHEKQALFYLSELRNKYPKIVSRILYVSVPYQELLEFDVPFDQEKYDGLKGFWIGMNKCLAENKPPKPADDVVFNEMTRNWKVNYQAEWCRYHDKCTGDPNWLKKAKDKVYNLNLKSTKGFTDPKKVEEITKPKRKYTKKSKK